LRIRRGFKVRRIAISDIAGAGLLFQETKGGWRWYPFVWRSDGSRERLSLAFYSPARLKKTGDPPGKKRLFISKGSMDVMGSTDPEKLAASKVALLVRELFEHVLGVQGPNGKLAQMQLQIHPPVGRWESVAAYWSPDGQTGAVDHVS
jgi:hypothetical protein